MHEIAALEHPNIIRWQAVWLDAAANSLVLISDLMPEGSLRQYLHKIKAPREKVVKQWTSQLLQALVFLHSRHPFPLVHSFLRPDSIYVIPNTGKVVVGGLCKAIIFRNTPLHIRKYEYMAPETFTDHPGTGVDIYALGMTVLEIISQSQPYDECKSPSEVYRKTVSGHKPESIERILNEDAKDFILECIRPVEERPSASELLQHKFLAANGNKEQGNKPVLLRNRSQEKLETHNASRNRTIDVELVLPDAATRRSKRIGFSYDLDKDTPDGVAMEMIEELHLSPSLIPELARQIGERIRPKRKSNTLSTKSTPLHESPPKSMQISIAAIDPPKTQEKLKAASCESSCTNTPQRAAKSIASSPKAAPPQLKSPLKFSAENDKADVCMVQTALNQILGPVVPTNGIFGRKTESSVKLFEEHLGLPPTGVVTEELWRVMWRRAREDLHAR